MTYLTTGCIVFDLLSLCFVVWIAFIRKRHQTVSSGSVSQPFDLLITSILSNSVSVCPAHLSPVVTKSLQDVALFIDADYANVMVIDAPKSTLCCEHEWCGDGIKGWKQELGSVSLSDAPWLSGKILNDQVVVIRRREEIPTEALLDRELPPIKAGIRSFICIPLRFGGRVMGCLTLGSFVRDGDWNDETVTRLRVLADAFGSAVERQKAAIALAISEQKYRSAFENAPLGVFQNTLDGKIISVNNEIARMVGATSIDELALHTSDIAKQFYVNPEERQQLIDRALDSDAYVTAEILERRIDGQIIVVRSRMRAVRDTGGSPIYLEGFLEDITEQKKSLAALTEAIAFDELATEILAEFASCPSSAVNIKVDKSLKRIAEFMDVDHGLIVLISDDRLSYSCTHEYAANKETLSWSTLQNIPVESLRKTSSYPTEMVEQRPFNIDDFLPQEAVGLIAERVLSDCVSSLSIPILRPDGGLKGILKLASTRSRDEWKQSDINRLRVVAEAVANVLQRARAEEDVVASELNYRSIFENAPIGIFQSSADGRLLSVNGHLARIMAYDSASEAVAANSDLRHQIYVNPADRDSLTALAFATQGFVRRECSFYRKDRAIIVADISMRVVKDRDGSFKFFEGFIEDVTKEKEYAKSLQRRLEFDKLITGIVAEFAGCDAEEVDDSINSALCLLAGVLRADHAYIIMVSPDGKSYTATHEWTAETVASIKPLYHNIPFGSVPWTEEMLMSDQVIILGNLADYPEAAAKEMQGVTNRSGRRSALGVPIHGKAGAIAGMIGMATYNSEVEWSESDITKLRIAGDAVAGVIERKNAEEAIQRQAEYDELIRKTLARFATCKPSDIDNSVEYALAGIGECFGGESAYLTLFSNTLDRYSCTHEWVEINCDVHKHNFQNIPINSAPEIEQEILADHVVTLSRSLEEDNEELIGIPHGVKSVLIVPVHGVSGTILGMVGLNSYRRYRSWTDKDVAQIRVVGDAIASLIDRRRVEDEVGTLNASLEERIVQRTSDLEEARRTAINIMHDVDEQRRRAEEALAQLELTTEHLRLLSQAVDNSPSMVMIIDHSHKIEYINPKFTEVTGYALDEIVGETPAFLQSDIDSEDLNREMALALSIGKSWCGEICSKRKSGELFWEYASFAPIKGPDGEVRHYVAVKEDITGRKGMQDELRLARDAAESANRTKSLFLANMSHEIRTPMNAILGFSQLLQNSKAFVGLDKQHLNIINRSGEHLLALINDILEMSKIEAGRVELSRSVVDLSAMVSDLTIMFRMRCSDKNISFSLEQIGKLPESVHTDENKIRQILINLLGNAVKLTEAGGVILRVAVGPAERGECCIVAEVEDTGPGIADDEKEKVFKPFEQTSSGLKSRSGTGLGLAISQQFAQMLDGEITFISRVNVGSTFRLVVPTEQVSSGFSVNTSSKLRVVGLAPGCKVRKVLVVDDEPENRTLLLSMLGEVGFDTNEAVEGNSALALFASWKPDVILMDAQMPEMDGYEAIRKLRMLRGGKKVPIIAVSASAFEEDRRRMLEAGANAFLAKPLRVDSVYSAIASVAGASYRYLDNPTVDEQARPSVVTPAELRQHAASMPHELASKIRRATIDADFDSVVMLVDQLSDFDQPLADTLRALAEQYEAARIINLLSPDS